MKKTKKDNLSTEDSFAKFNEQEINLHIAEYNALTTRTTYFINFQFILLTALLAWIIVIVTIWDSKLEHIYIWGLLLGAQLIGIINAFVTHEYYNIVTYLESDLKPEIIKLIKNKSFWSYESFLIKERGKKNIKNWKLFFEFLAVIFSGVIIIAIFIYRIHEWILGDYIGLFLNIIFLIIQFILTNQSKKLRLRNWHP